MPNPQDLALIVLPAIIFYTAVCLIAHATIARIWQNQPAFFTLLVFIAARCLVYLQGAWFLNTALSLVVFPAVMLLVAEESIRSCYASIGDAGPRRALYLRCIFFGAMISSIAWAAIGTSTYPGAPRWAFVWRIQADACAIGMMALAFSDIVSLKRTQFVDRHVLRRQGIMIIYVAGALLASGVVDVSRWWNATLLTEFLQIGCLMGLHASVPFSLRSGAFVSWLPGLAPLSPRQLALRS